MLPPGAAPPATPRSAEPIVSPPSTPSQHERLLAESDDQHVQFATYPDKSSNVNLSPLKRRSSSDEPIAPARTWTPLPLRPYVYIPYILLLILLAVALEVSFHFSQRNGAGFRVHGNPDALGRQTGVWHYIYTLPPVALAMFVVGMWAWTDIEIKKLQPYVDLVQGDSPPQRSLLLDYTRHHTLLVWMPALENRHYTVFLASMLAILTLAFQPLAAALLEVKDVWWSLPEMSTSANTVMGLAPGLGSSGGVGVGATPDINSPIGDMSVFLSASGYASASALYPDLPKPPFVTYSEGGTGTEGWTLMDIALPNQLPPNGTTVAMNVTALKTTTNCRRVDVNKQQLATGNWTNTVDDAATGCGLTWNVTRTGPNLFGANVTLCRNESIPIPGGANGTAGLTQTNPALFWFFTYLPTAQASATICTPTIELFDVTATLSLTPAPVNAAGETQVGSTLTKVVVRNPFNVQSSQYGGSAGNLSALVNSTTNSIPAFNGLDWDSGFTSTDSTVRDRLSGVRIVMPAAIWQVATGGGSQAGVDGAFGSNKFVALSDRVYVSYLSLLAKSLYFVDVPASSGGDSQNQVALQVKTTVKRLFLSPFATHFLTALLFILALMSLLIHVTHTHARRNLHLRHLPGTIASAVSIGGQTGTSALLSGKVDDEKRGLSERELKDALKERRFRIDPRTMKIVMEGEDGYASATSPNRGEFVWIGDALKRGSRRISVFGGGGGGGGGLGGIGEPKTPRTPRSAEP